MSERQKLDSIYQSINSLVEEVKDFAHASYGHEDKGWNNDIGKNAESVERHIFGELLKVGRMLMEEYFKELGKGDKGSKLERHGVVYSRKICKPVSLLTVFGMVLVDRWLYYAPGYSGYSVTEAKANMPDRQASHFVQRLIGRMSLRDTYEECVSLLGELFGLSLSTHTSEEIVKELAVDHAPFAEKVDVPCPSSSETIQVVSFDGKGVPIVKEKVKKREARLKKGKKRNRKKEAMVGLEYVMAPRVRDAELLARALVMPEELSEAERQNLHSDRPAQNIYYQASLDSGKEGIMKEISVRVRKRLEASDRPLKQACVIDGAISLSRSASKEFPDAEIILDIVHVSERFWKAAYLFHREGSSEAKIMAYDLTLRTLQGKIGHVIGGLKQRAKKRKLSKHKQKGLKAILTYLQNHRRQMRYDRYLKAGFPIATGVVESACGHLVKDRMEKAGARWSLTGAEAMLRLRSIYVSKNWDDYLSFHQSQEYQRLYEMPTAA